MSHDNLIAIKRIKKDIKEVKDILQKNEGDSMGILNLELVDDQYTKLWSTIRGPPSTPYADGTFQLSINIPESYPFTPPSIYFLTKIWHPNISSVTGVICLDILKDEWAAVLSVRSALLSIQALLASPEANDPQDAVVAKQYKYQHDLFVLTATHWTNVYAAGPAPVVEFDRKVKRFTEMGLNEHTVRVALSLHGWDLHRAQEHLFG